MESYSFISDLHHVGHVPNNEIQRHASSLFLSMCAYWQFGLARFSIEGFKEN